MIVASFALVIVAIGLLVAGILVQQMLFIYISIGLSALAALLLGAGAFRRRDELIRTEKGTEASASGKEVASSSGASRARVSKAAGAGASRTGAAGAATATKPPAEAAAEVPDDAQVWVVPGRRRYHLPGCRQLRRQESQELTYAEAIEQGFMMCGSCMPDTALAARDRSGAAPEDSESPPSPSGTEEEPPGLGGEPASSGGDAAAAAGEAEGATVDTKQRPDTSTEAQEEAGLVGMVSGGRRFHRLSCPVVEDAVQDGIDLTTMGRDEADAADAIPCTVCRP